MAVDVLLSSGIVTLTSTFMKEMKRSGYGALSLVTPGGKSNITISKCIFKDTSMNAMRGRIVKIVSGNGNAGMVKNLGQSHKKYKEEKSSFDDKSQVPH